MRHSDDYVSLRGQVDDPPGSPVHPPDGEPIGPVPDRDSLGVDDATRAILAGNGEQQRLRLIWNDGRRACGLGRPACECPHAEGTLERDRYRNGYVSKRKTLSTVYVTDEMYFPEEQEG